MMTPVGVLVTLVILALLISLIVTLRISSKVADNNARLVEKVTSLEQSEPHQEPSLSSIPQGNLPADMTDSELCRWFDAQTDELRLYCQPDIDLKTVAQTLGITQRSIIQMLKATENNSLTFAEYITRKRLAYACQLLKEKPNWNIDAVAREAGIVSDATFRRLFRKHYGMTPSEYRDRQRHTKTD